MVSMRLLGTHNMFWFKNKKIIFLLRTLNNMPFVILQVSPI